MYIFIGGSISGFGNIQYDLETFLSIAKQLGEHIEKSYNNPIMIFAGSPCSDCLSLQIAKDHGYLVEYHLPCDGLEEKLMKEYNALSSEYREYLINLFLSMQIRDKEVSIYTVYSGHTARNNAIAAKCDIFYAITTMSHSLFLDPPEQIRKNSGTVYVWNKCQDKDRYHYSLESKDMIKI